MITFVFWAQFIILVAGIARGDKKASTIKMMVNVSERMKLWSTLIIFLDVFFLSLIGEYEKKNEPESLDQRFKANFPTIYRNLNLIGFRVWVNPYTPICVKDTHASKSSFDPNEHDCVEEQALIDKTKFKFYAYVAYLMLSIYLSNFLGQEQATIEREKSFTEKDYTKLF